MRNKHKIYASIGLHTQNFFENRTFIYLNNVKELRDIETYLKDSDYNIIRIKYVDMVTYTNYNFRILGRCIVDMQAFNHYAPDYNLYYTDCLEPEIQSVLKNL